MNKKFLFAIMAIAAGLVFGSCASEEEQTEEVVEEPVVEEIDTTAIDTIAEEPVVEEVAAPAPKKTAKKAAVKEEAQPTVTEQKPAVITKKVTKEEEGLKAANEPQLVKNGKPVRKVATKEGEEPQLKAAAPVKK